MNILEKVSPVIENAARRADAEKAQAIIAETQKMWDAGESFVSTGFVLDDFYPRQREDDRDEEVEAAARALETQLAQLAIDGAMKAILKETAAAMCEALENSDPYASVTLFGEKMPVRVFADRWNKIHPGNEFYMVPGFEN